jgi:redox-sensitive bicupin YhaK (pirin superfamily)
LLLLGSSCRCQAQQLASIAIAQQEHGPAGGLDDIANPAAHVDALLAGHLVAVEGQPDQRLGRNAADAIASSAASRYHLDLSRLPDRTRSVKGLAEMLELVIEERRRDLGGFEVGRVLPFAKRRMVGPFIFLDHMGPIALPAGVSRNVDVRPHPHIGLSTATYLFEGEVMHRDSVGSEQPIRPGEINWMTAGRGITHSERFERARREGGVLHGIQAWVALPEKDEEADPTFSHHGPEDLPTYAADGLWARLLAGAAFGATAKVQTLSPLFYVHWELQAGAKAQLPAEYPERAAYLVAGSVEVAGNAFEAGRMLVFSAGDPVTFTALTPATVMLLGGEPLGQRFIEWNFVSSSQARIEDAKADWRAGRMKLPDLDNQEFVPLP